MVHAIETSYKGYRFRSRTEARWAVFFDTLGIKWEYEAEGYKLSDGSCYLPDFKLLLPNQAPTCCEIKGGQFDDYDDNELHQRWLFANETESRIILLTGVPELRVYDMIPIGSPFRTLNAVFFKDYNGFIGVVDQYWQQMLKLDTTTGRMSFAYMNDRRAEKAFGRDLIKAIKNARAARFELGESPLVPEKN